MSTKKMPKNAEKFYCEKCERSLPDRYVEGICPHCKKEGEATTLYKLKSFEGVKAYVFECGSCGKKLGITKKMKEGKKK